MWQKIKRAWEKFNLFFFHLTFNNWGFPWHILICLVLLKLGVKLFPVQIVFVIVFVLGIANELIQLWRAKRTRNKDIIDKQKKDSFQDLIANLIGLILGLLL